MPRLNYRRRPHRELAAPRPADRRRAFDAEWLCDRILSYAARRRIADWSCNQLWRKKLFCPTLTGDERESGLPVYFGWRDNTGSTSGSVIYLSGGVTTSGRYA